MSVTVETTDPNLAQRIAVALAGARLNDYGHEPTPPDFDVPAVVRRGAGGNTGAAVAVGTPGVSYATSNGGGGIGGASIRAYEDRSLSLLISDMADS